MSSCLGGGRRAAYGIDLDIIKSPSNSARTYNSSSPSSSISESSDSPVAASIRKQRTPRKRPRQTYTEAAALLSTAYPNIFSSDELSKPCKFTKRHLYSSFYFEDSTDEFLIPFPVDKPALHIDSYDYGCNMISSNLCAGCEDFDTQSILDEEIEEGVIDSIMGNLGVCPEEIINTCNNGNGNVNGVGVPVDFCYGYPVGLGLGLGLGFDERVDYGYGMMRGETKAFRQDGEGEWWRFPTVNVGEISPQLNKPKSPVKKKKKKKKKKMMKLNAKPLLTQSKENSALAPKPSSNKIKEELTPNTKLSSKENSVPLSVPQPKAGLFLKLKYEEVLDAWSDKGSLFSEDLSGSEFSGMDASARLAQIDLFSDNGALREASVQRYKEKRQTRLFSKKIRYHVRKVNADQRPRMKGRFVRRPKSTVSQET